MEIVVATTSLLGSWMACGHVPSFHSEPVQEDLGGQEGTVEAYRSDLEDQGLLES